MVAWSETMPGSLLGRVATVGDYELSIIGGEHVWCWLVCRGRDNLAVGTECSLGAATSAAEDATRRLMGDPVPGAA